MRFQVLTVARMKFRVFWDVVTLKLINVSKMRTASIIRAIMEAVRTYETSVIFSVITRRYMPEDSKLQ
jgi:hypothetical protein